MLRQQRLQLVGAPAQLVARDGVRQLAHAMPVAQAEDVGEEHLVLVAPAARTAPPSRSDSAPRSRRARSRAASARACGRSARAPSGRPPSQHGARHERAVLLAACVVSTGTTGFTQSSSSHAVLQRHRGVQRLEQHAVHAGATVDLHRRIEPGHAPCSPARRARWERLCAPGRAEADRAPGLEIGRHDHQLRAQLPEVVGAAVVARARAPGSRRIGSLSNTPVGQRRARRPSAVRTAPVAAAAAEVPEHLREQARQRRARAARTPDSWARRRARDRTAPHPPPAGRARGRAAPVTSRSRDTPRGARRRSRPRSRAAR